MSSNPKSSTSTCWKKSWHSKECRKFLDLRCAVAASALEHEVSPSGRGGGHEVRARIWPDIFGKIFWDWTWKYHSQCQCLQKDMKGIIICQQILSWNNKDVRCKRIYRTSCWLHSPYKTQSFIVYVESRLMGFQFECEFLSPPVVIGLLLHHIRVTCDDCRGLWVLLQPPASSPWSSRWAAVLGKVPQDFFFADEWNGYEHLHLHR